MTNRIERFGCRGDVGRKLEHAPAWVRQRSGVALRLAPPAPPARPVKPVKVSTRWVLAGYAAPSVSSPVAIPGADRLREMIDSRAWVEALARVARGGVKDLVMLRTAHDGGRYLASSGNGSLSLRADPQLGLHFVAEVADELFASSLVRRAAESDGVAVSIGFAPLEAIVIRWSNGPIRLIRRLRLDHLALVGVADAMRPAYPGARCFAGPVGSAERLLERSREYARRYGFGNV